jgi:ligand-binding sensor domain-containing protein
MKKVYTLFLFFFFIVSCKGQDTTKTVGISITSDPASDIVSAALKDKNGDIWFGTRNQGVDRYDGKVITNFSKKDGLGNNDVSCIFEDKNGNIWFGSNFTGVGICFYNGKSFTNVTAKEILTDKEGWLYSVMTIAQDNDGHLWFGSRGGYIFRYNGKSFTDFSEKVFKQQ